MREAEELSVLSAIRRIQGGDLDPDGLSHDDRRGRRLSFSGEHDPKGFRTPVHPLWRYQE